MPMMRCLLAILLVLSLAAVPAHAGERDPTPAELARMIVRGNAAQQALVAKWLEDADRDTLRKVFAEVRKLATAPKPAAVPATPPPAPVPPAVAAKPGQPMLDAEIRVIDVDPKEASKLFGRHRPTAQKTWHILTGAEVSDLLRGIEKNTKANVISAPRILVLDGQKANVSLLDQVSYIKDYEIEVMKDGTQVANPVVDVIQDGLVIDFKSDIAENGTDVHVDFVGTWAALRRPIPELEREVNGQTLTLQLPEIAVTRAKAKTTVPGDRWALIGSGSAFGHGDKKVERVALLRVKPITVDPKTLEDAGAEVRLEPAPRVRKK